MHELNGALYIVVYITHSLHCRVCINLRQFSLLLSWSGSSLTSDSVENVCVSQSFLRLCTG